MYQLIKEERQLNLNWFDSRIYAIDTETTGLDFHLNDILLLQIAKENGDIIVIDCKKVNILKLKDILEDPSILKIGHNIKFDYNVLRKVGIEMQSMRCTYLMERLLTSGLPVRYGLGNLIKKYFNIDIDKSLQQSFTDTDIITTEQLDYAANDVKYLIDLYKLQKEQLNNLNMLKVAKLEMDVIPAFADIEWFGMKMDKAKLNENIVAWEQSLELAKNECFLHSGIQPDMFGHINLDLNSPKQIKDYLIRIGYDIDKTDKNQLMKLQHPFVKALLKYRKVMKKLSTYGYPFREKLNVLTGRIHPSIRQMGTDTGRPSASDPNMLNIPREDEVRNMFVADEGRVLIDADYSGCELRILGDNSNDERFIGGFNGGIDFHCYVASMLFNREVTKTNENKKLRNPAKSLNFGLCYGIGASKLHENLNNEGHTISLDECVKMVKDYKTKVFPIACNYLDEIGSSAQQNGYAVTKSGRRRFFELPNFTPTDEDFALFQKYSMKGIENDFTSKIIFYKARFSGIKREGANHVIQGGNADITKTAMKYLWNELKNGKYNANICNQVYDEIIVECDEDISEEVAEIQKKCMLKAEQDYFNSIQPEIELSIGKVWSK